MNYGEAALRPETRHSNLMLSYKKSQVHYEPLGVVAAIVSWNYRSCNFTCIPDIRVDAAFFKPCTTPGPQFSRPSSPVTRWY